MSSDSSSDIYAETLDVFEARDAPLEPLSTTEVAEALGAKRRTIYKRLATLVERGDLRTKEVGSRARVWWLPRDGASASHRPDRDVAEPERVTDPLRESETRYRQPFDSIDEGFCIVEALFDDAGEPADYRFVETNAAFVEQMSVEDAVGRTVRELEPDHERDWFDTYRSIVGRGESARNVVVAGTLEGRWYDVYAFPYGDPGDDQVAILFEDFTETRAYQRDLERYEHVLQTVPDGVWALDSDDRFTLVNEAYCELTGYEREELLGQHATLVTSESTNEEANAFGERIGAGEIREAVLDADVNRADGTILPVESRFTQYELEGGDVARCGVVRDVTERNAREDALAASERRYRTLVENFPNGAVALFDEGLRYRVVGGTLFDELESRSADLEDRLLDEVLPPEMVAKVRPYFAAVFEGQDGEFEVEYGDAVRTFHTIPIRDESGDVVSGLVMSQDVTERRERERQLEAQQQRLSTLNHLNSVVRDITHAVIEQSTREEIERTVCESLAASDTYEFAWIAQVDPTEGQVVPRTEAGVDGYLDAWRSRSIDLYDLWSGGPIGRAIRTGELHVTEDVFDDPHFEQWQDYAREYGYRSVAGIPIESEGSLYGILGLYGKNPGAFDGRARLILAQFGDIVGHAIAAAERKQALMGDDVVELQFQVSDYFGALGVPVSTEGRIAFERTTPLEGEDVLVYGTATDDGIEALEAVVAANTSWNSLSIVERRAEWTRFVVQITDPPIVSTVTERGGYLVQSVVEGGDSYVTVHLPTIVDVRDIVEAIREAFPNLVMVTRRQVQLSQPPRGRIQRILTEEMTERQRSALEAAFNAGYFDTPKTCSGEEVADTLGISTSTFHQHLRVAERKLLDGVTKAAQHGPQPTSPG